MCWVECDFANGDPYFDNINDETNSVIENFHLIFVVSCEFMLSPYWISVRARSLEVTDFVTLYSFKNNFFTESELFILLRITSLLKVNSLFL